jgi:hypothetical membrane protein
MRPHLGHQPQRTRQGRLQIRGIMAFATAGLLVAIAVTSDIADRTHSLARDPVSYFGAASAPYPAIFNGSLALLGAALITWGVGRRVREPRRFLVLVALGIMVLGLALFPIDCSPVDDLCELFIRNRVHSATHRVHALIAVALFATLTALVVHATVRPWRKKARFSTRLMAAVVAFGAILLVARITIRPFSQGTALAEILLVLLGAASVVRLRSIDHDGAES